MGVVKGKDLIGLPGIWDIMTRGDENDRQRYSKGIGIASVLLLASAVVSISHQRRLASAPASPRRHHYRIVHLLPLVVACTCWLTIVAPKVAVVNLFVQEVWEAVALHYFSIMIICLMGGPEETIKTLATQEAHGLFGSSNRWCVPPCCCLVPVLPCFFHDGRAIFDLTALLKIRSMIEQYCYVAPATALISMIFDFHGKAKHQAMEAMEVLVQTVQAISMFVCLHALFVLYKSSLHPLQQYRTTRKFLTIKAMIILSLVQKLAMVWLSRTEVFPLPTSGVFSRADAATRLQAFLLLAEVPFLQLLVNDSFPLSELLHVRSDPEAAFLDGKGLRSLAE